MGCKVPLSRGFVRASCPVMHRHILALGLRPRTVLAAQETQCQTQCACVVVERGDASSFCALGLHIHAGALISTGAQEPSAWPVGCRVSLLKGSLPICPGIRRADVRGLSGKVSGHVTVLVTVTMAGLFPVSPRTVVTQDFLGKRGNVLSAPGVPFSGILE